MPAMPYIGSFLAKSKTSKQASSGAISLLSGTATYFAQQAWQKLLKSRHNTKTPTTSTNTTAIVAQAEPIDYDKWLQTVEEGNIEKVKQLLENPGIDINKRCEQTKRTALLIALRHKKLDIANMLLDHGANSKPADWRGNTALHYACEYGYLEIAKKILNKGADINACNTKFDRVYGIRPPLIISLQHKNPDIANMLLDRGADPKLADWCGYTPLHYACKHGYLEIVGRLVKKGVDINTQEKQEQQTPLLIALKHNSYYIANILLDYGAD